MSPVIALWLGHEQLATAQLYLNSQELHQTGAFSLVAWWAGFRNGCGRWRPVWPDLAGCAVIPSGA